MAVCRKVEAPLTRAADGAADGAAVGAVVGCAVGAADGVAVGATVGTPVGAPVGVGVPTRRRRADDAAVEHGSAGLRTPKMLLNSSAQQSRSLAFAPRPEESPRTHSLSISIFQNMNPRGRLLASIAHQALQIFSGGM